MSKHGDPLREYIAPRSSVDASKYPELATFVASPHGDPLRERTPRARPLFSGVVRPVHISISLPRAWHSKADEAVARRIHGCMMVSKEHPRDAGVTLGYGVGVGYGLERCAHITTCTPLDPTPFIVKLCAHFAQDCAYVEVDGLGWEVNALGTWAPITGRTA